ncbi:polyprenyl synthetase family protein [uncultured Chitinophaga sp.]|jgi:Geranylgeranyl pyrophosphate synthase|uniref:polyprenyl synthetase family protein n=1 Tax=uncultured Chitinophaga sp. TaxID=339340 RepID=UPI002632A5A7|nr:polyprenyl synthetase family protein [uncultured Chitinophaga sp.]
MLTPFTNDIKAKLFAHIPPDWQALKYIAEKWMEKDLPPETGIPMACCQYAGGNALQATGVTAALLAGAISLRILDDLSDKDRVDTLWNVAGENRAWNFAFAFKMISLQILHTAIIDNERRNHVQEVYLDKLMQMGAGQDMDLSNRAATFESYWKMMDLKAGTPFGCAAWLGAVAVSANRDIWNACYAYGHHLGLAIQILNDREGIWSGKSVSDLDRGKVTLPLLYALYCEHTHKERVQAIVNEGTVSTHASWLRGVLEEIEAPQYLVWAAWQHRSEALAAIQNGGGKAAGARILEAYVNGIFGDLVPDGTLTNSQAFALPQADVSADRNSVPNKDAEYRSASLRLRQRI